MISGFFNKRREKKQVTVARNKQLGGINNFPLDDEWKASDKKKVELEELTSLLVDLIDNHDFEVMRSWGAGLPKDCYLRRISDSTEMRLEASVDVTGQNHDRVGRISIGLDWSYDGIYDDRKDKYVGEIDEAKECTLKAANKLLPEILSKFENL